MKTLAQLRKELESCEKILGFNPLLHEQQSPQWFTMKLGVISASKAKEILAKSSSATKRTYICSLVAQVATGMAPEINARALDWGNQHEDAARAAYEFETGKEVVELPFIYGDASMRYGASPDGLVLRSDGNNIERGSEIKCPYNSENFIKFACDDTIKKEHEKQCQFSMFVTGAEFWDYGNYDPRMTTKQLHWYTYERDEKTMRLFEEAVQEVVYEMDVMLDSLGLKFGAQWKTGVVEVAAS